MAYISSAEIDNLIHELRFGKTPQDAKAKLIEVGEPAVEPLIKAIGDNAMLERYRIATRFSKLEDYEARNLITNMINSYLTGIW